MKTEVIRIDPLGGDSEAVRRAAAVLSDGGLIAFPTETVYGVAARADIPSAMNRLREIKSRPTERAFTVHIGSAADVARFVPGLSGVAARFARKAWPGPLTLILPVDDPSAAPVAAELNGSGLSAIYRDKTIGLRCPDNAVALALLNGVEGPVVAASANRAGNPPPESGRAALAELGDGIDILLDAGQTKYSKPSTIVRVTGSTYELVREGVYDAGIIERLSVLRILLVCTGNTCRSPMAEGIFRKLLAERLGCDVDELSGRGVEVGSAGTAGGRGVASPHGVTVMARRGIDLSGHVSRALTGEMIRQADYVYAVTRSHLDRVIELEPSVADRAKSLIEGRDVRDPIGGSEDEYERCAQLVEQGAAARLQEVTI